MTDLAAPTLWLANPLRPDRPAVPSSVTVEPARIAGLVVPAWLAFELRLVQRGVRAPLTAGLPPLPYAGPVELRVGERRAYTGALIDGQAVRLGLLALEELDLLVDPRTGLLRLDEGAGISLAGAPDEAALNAWALPPDAP